MQRPIIWLHWVAHQQLKSSKRIPVVFDALIESLATLKPRKHNEEQAGT
ncbi:MAG: hypothetical protein AB8B87_26430 [Granulosicoccus sp.]